ncbi:MAG: hypothetical protein PVF43_17070, partial [Candidatus Eiseniibacteriota bacterium]
MSNARTLQVHRTPRPAAVPIRAVVRAGIPLIVAVVLIAGASATAEAAWSADPALNLAVADAT